VVAYSLKNTAGTTLYKRGLNKIVILKKFAEISRAVISSDLLSPIFFSQVFQSYPSVFINLIYEILQHGIKQQYFVKLYRFENEPPFYVRKNYMFNYYHKINNR
jgi:hypothetical protein